MISVMSVEQATLMDEDSKYPVFQSLPAYLDFHDLNPKSTGLGNYRSVITVNLHISFQIGFHKTV